MTSPPTFECVRRGEIPSVNALLRTAFSTSNFGLSSCSCFHSGAGAFEIMQVADRNFVETDIGRAELLRD